MELEALYEGMLTEAFIGELASKYATLDIPAIEAWANTMYNCCIDWALRASESDERTAKQYDISVKKLFVGVTKYRGFAIQALRDIHELEYKQSQLKKFYSNPEKLRETELTLTKLAKWLKEYLGVILFSRAAGDGINHDERGNGIKQDIQTVIKNFGHIAKGYSIDGKKKLYKNYITPIFIELYNSKTLPQMLIAISKAKNAEHDGGLIMTEWGTGLFFGNEKAFKEISNLNHRKMDQELQQELQ